MAACVHMNRYLCTPVYTGMYVEVEVCVCHACMYVCMYACVCNNLCE